MHVAVIVIDSWVEMIRHAGLGIPTLLESINHNNQLLMGIETSVTQFLHFFLLLLDLENTYTFI